MTTKWKDLAQNPFNSTYKEPIETADTLETLDPIVEQAGGLIDRFEITSTDGRRIPVLIDNSTRSVYPIRKEV